MNKVKYKGSSKEQRNWGWDGSDYGQLVVGKVYDVEREEVHSCHTKIFLEGIKGSFNSVCFAEVTP